jgi:chromosome segregation ATPase
MEGIIIQKESKTEPDDLKRQVDLLIKLVAEMESVATRAETVAARESEQLKENLVAKMTVLEAQLREKEEILRTRDSAIRELEENLDVKVRDLEGQLREKEGLLVGRDLQLEKLESKMDALVEELSQIRGDKERMSSETERLRSEVKERKLLLAKAETEEWRSIGRRNSWKRRLAGLGIFVQGPVGKQGANHTTAEQEANEPTWSVDFTKGVEPQN